jgi:peptide/nickel transport system permease protein
MTAGSVVDRLLMAVALLFISAPVYFFGLVALFLFSDDLGLVKIFPGNSAYNDAQGFFDKAWTLVLPWCVLAAAFAAIYARFLRGNLIDTMQEDYIRTARAKGLSERRVVFRHGVRAAITPIVTLLGLDIGILLGGAILTETVFNIPGIGRYAYNAIVQSDLPVIQGTVLFGAFFIVSMSLIVDILYAFIDPRVRY